MAWTYILQCGDGSYYVGSTRDLDFRMMQHAAGEGGDYTRKRLPVQLVWAQEAEHIGIAYELEKKVQGWSRAKREALIAGRFDLLPSLSKKRNWNRPSKG